MPKRSDNKWPDGPGPTFPPDDSETGRFPGDVDDDRTRVGGRSGPVQSPEPAGPGASSDHTVVYRPPQPVETPEAAFAWLVAVEGDAKGKTFNLAKGQNLIGRHPECSIRFHSPFISNFHAVVRIKEGVAKVWDLGGDNGTSVNGNQITAVELNDGDRIELPGQVLVYKKV